MGTQHAVEKYDGGGTCRSFISPNGSGSSPLRVQLPISPLVPNCSTTGNYLPESSWLLMASTGLNGPYSLTSSGVSDAVKQKSAGAYALGKTDNGVFAVHYVGRSDDDVANRLQQHVSKWYPDFKFGYFSSPKAAFEKECHLYHDFTPPDNKVHPARPAGSNWSCPACTIFD